LGRLLAMATEPPIPPENEGPPFGPGPYSAGEIRILNLILEIKEKMGGTGHATRTLEDTSRIHDERLLGVIREADRTDAVLPDMRSTIARHDRDLNGLGKVAHTAKTLGYIALTLAGIVGTAFVAYLFRK
jgi:hypothetical protein